MPNQLSPFILLTSTRGNKRVMININHIVHIEDQTYTDSKTRITYISLTSPATTSLHVKENFDQVAQLIAKYHA